MAMERTVRRVVTEEAAVPPAVATGVSKDDAVDQHCILDRRPHRSGAPRPEGDGRV
jgi:hypothetical protein